MKVKVTITGKQGKKRCEENHRIGEVFIVDGKTPSNRICHCAFHSIYPNIRALLEHKQTKSPKVPLVRTICCPDPDALMEFTLELIN